MIITQEILDIVSPAQLNSPDDRRRALSEHLYPTSGEEICVEEVYLEALAMLFDQSAEGDE